MAEDHVTVTDTDHDFDPEGVPETDVVVDAPRPRRKRKGTTRRAMAVAVAAGLAVGAAPVELTGNVTIDIFERFLLVGIVTFVGAHAHRWAWFAAGAVTAAVVRDLPLFLVLAGIGVAVTSTRVDRRAKDVGAVSVGLMLCGIFWSAGHNIGWPTVPASIVVITILVVSGFPNMRRVHRRNTGTFAFVVLLAAIASVGLTAFALIRANSDVTKGSNAARAALAAVRRGDTDTAQRQLDAANLHLGRADRSLGLLVAPASYIPGAAQQVNAVTTSLTQARKITAAATSMVATNYHDLRYQGRIDLAQVRGLIRPTAAVAEILAGADEELTELRSTWLLPPLEKRVDKFADDVASARSDTELAATAVAIVPNLLGAVGERHYVVVFLTPAELRGGGGFIGSWAELTAAGGKVRLSQSGRIADLIDLKPKGARELRGPADYVHRYGRFAPQDFLQDVPYSPNWPSNASVFANLYEQTTGVRVNGVIGVDPKGLSALLELTGPVQVEGLNEPLDSKNAVELLTKRQYIEFTERSEREDILAAATKATFEKLVDSSLPAPQRIGAVLGPAARGRHLQLWSPIDVEQLLFHSLHADSAFGVPTGHDGFTVVQQNVGNNKLDAYLQRSISYDIDVDASDGSFEGTMTVTLENQNTNLLLPNAVVANLRGAPRGTNVASVSIFAPWVVRTATIDGKPDRLGTDEEVGLHVWDTPVLQVPPGGKKTIVAKIRGTLDLADGYRLHIFPQPVANADILQVRVRIDGARFGTPTGDVGNLKVSATPQELRMSGRLDENVDIEVPATR
ncbi:MAG: DUF4012 domain-containing protein [Acidimicrobiales bacterium]|nr:DUF4012 domain-containing protein [Acidimicrobiales bacterium]